MAKTCCFQESIGLERLWQMLMSICLLNVLATIYYQLPHEEAL